MPLAPPEHVAVQMEEHMTTPAALSLTCVCEALCLEFDIKNCLASILEILQLISKCAV